MNSHEVSSSCRKLLGSIVLLLAMVLFVGIDVDNGNGGLPDRVILLVLVVLYV